MPRKAQPNGEVGRVIRAARSKRGIERKVLAAEVHMQPHSVSRIELGTRTLAVSMAIAWAHVLGCAPAVLVQAALQDQVSAAGSALVVVVMEIEGR